jgi:hypothetical protein
LETAVAKRNINGTEPIFTVTLDRGMADRNRMPFADVIRFLNELKNLIVETGKQIGATVELMRPWGTTDLKYSPMAAVDSWQRAA